MRKNVYIIAACVLMSIDLSAQSFQWVNSGGGADIDESYSAALDSAGNVYTTGLFSQTANIGGSSYTSSGGTNIFIAKYTSAGNTAWVRTAGGAANSGGHVLTVDKQSNVYTAGEFEDTITIGTTTFFSSGMSDIFILKYDGTGNFQWALKAGGSGKDVASSIKADAVGNVYITGHFEDTVTFGVQQLISAGGKDLFVAKFDAAGNLIWLAGAGGPSDDESRGIAVDDNGNSFIAGHFDSTATFGSTTLTNTTGGKNVFIAYLDSSGIFQWTKSAVSNGVDDAYDVTIDHIGNCFVAGYFHDTIAFDSNMLMATGNDDAFIARYDAAGNALWAVKAGGTNGDRAYSMSSDTTGNVFVTGSFEDTVTVGTVTLISSGDKDVFTVKYNSSGNVMWAMKAGGAGFDRGYGIANNYAGNEVYITGTYDQDAVFGSYTATNVGMTDLFLAKVNDVTGVQAYTSADKIFSVYPNPATNNIGVIVSDFQKLPQQLQLYNSMGENIFSFTINEFHSMINLSHLPTGLYLVKVNDSIEKIIKR